MQERSYTLGDEDWCHQYQSFVTGLRYNLAVMQPSSTVTGSFKCAPILLALCVVLQSLAHAQEQPKAPAHYRHRSRNCLRQRP